MLKEILTNIHKSMGKSFVLSLDYKNKRYNLGGKRPAFQVNIANRRALLALISLDISNIARAYINKTIDIKGSLYEALQIKNHINKRELTLLRKIILLKEIL